MLITRQTTTTDRVADVSTPEGARPPIDAVPSVDAPRDAAPPAASHRGWRTIDAPSRVQAAEVGGRFLYVAEQGTVLRREGTRVLVTKGDTVLLQVPAMRLQGALVYGAVQVTNACIRNLVAEGVWLTFFSRTGSYRGRLQPPCERGGRLRRRQWTRASDPAFCLDFARAVVRGKILAQQRVADAYAKNRAAESLGTGRTQLRASLARVGDAPDLAALRGIEGTATRAYFGLFGRWNGSELPFTGREKRGTADPINALLNLGYTMLTRELEGLIEGAGLDPTIGFYHAPDDDRPSLACDWVEEFRHPVVDRLVLTLVNKRTIGRQDFEEVDERRGIRLTREGLRKFLAAYDRAMRRPPNADDGSAVAGIRSVMLGQLARLLDAIAGRAPYRSHLEPPPRDARPAAPVADTSEAPVHDDGLQTAL
jgi:CRISPR-associated protein Cas1